MTFSALTLLCLVFFATSVVSVVTGATSLITVPVLLSFGVEPRTALATNVLALIWLSAGGSVTFLRSGDVEQHGLPFLLALTFAGSVVGALLLFATPESLFRVIVAFAMLGAAFVVLRPPRQTGISRSLRKAERLAGQVATLLLAIYGGFFSGGYVTMLTAVWTTLLGMPFKERLNKGWREANGDRKISQRTTR